MPDAEGRLIHDADAHIVETPDWLEPYADPDTRPKLKPIYVSTVKPGDTPAPAKDRVYSVNFVDLMGAALG